MARRCRKKKNDTYRRVGKLTLFLRSPKHVARVVVVWYMVHGTILDTSLQRFELVGYAGQVTPSRLRTEQSINVVRIDQV